MSERTIRTLAKEMAEQTWEENQDPKNASDRFRKFWPRKHDFIARNWPSFYPIAKKTLIAMLSDKNTTDAMKEAISRSLVEDFDKNANKRGVQPGVGQLMLNPHHPGRMERKIFDGEK